MSDLGCLSQGVFAVLHVVRIAGVFNCSAARLRTVNGLFSLELLCFCSIPVCDVICVLESVS